MKSSFFSLTTVTFAIVLILSCTPGAYRESTIPNGDTLQLTPSGSQPQQPNVIASGDLIVNDPEEIISLVDTLASNAEIAALQNDFPRAHKLFVIALELITTFGQDNVFDTLDATDTVYNRIAEFYVDLLPSQYLDSVPVAISSFVSRYQLNEMMNDMDSTVVENNDYPFACGEGTIYNIPVSYNRRVQQAIKALTNPKRFDTMTRLLGRCHFYRPFMIEMYSQAGLPTDLTFLPLLESAFNPKAYSPAHASGLWQFIPSTGSMYKMRDNYWVDERRDPIKATEAAISYFSRLYRMFNDWHLSLASYNCGEGRVSRTMARTGARTFWELQLPAETMNYVPLFIAYQIIAKNPQCFGYTVDTTAKTFDYDTVKVSDCISLQQIASATGTTFDNLKEINPHIKQWCTPPNMTNVNIYLPAGSAQKFKEFYNKLTDNDRIVWHRYMVKSGDNLESIAQKYGVSSETLKTSNKMSGTTLAVGRYIVIPLPANKTFYDSTAEIEPISADTMKSSMQEPKQQYTTVKRSVTKTVRKFHTVKRGETLSSIARKYDVNLKDLARWNGISTSKKLGAGKRLKVFKLEKTTITIRKKVPVTGTSATPDKSTTQDRQYYSVQSGEGLSEIATKLGVTVDQLIDWNNLEKENPVVHPEQKLLFYNSKRSPVQPEKKNDEPKTKTEPKSSQSSGSDNGETYTVKAGETLYSISQKLNVSLKDLCEWNGKDFNNPSLQADEKLKYYSASSTPVKQNSSSKKEESVKPSEPKQSYTVSTGETMSSIADRIGVSVEKLCSWNNRSSSNPVVYKGEQIIYYGAKVKDQATVSKTKETTNEKQSYTVESGETMASISQKLGISVKQLCEWNNRSSSKPVVYRGEKLTYYGDSQSVSEKNEVPEYRGVQKIYKVSSGGKIATVAKKLGVTVKELCEWNKGFKSTSVFHKGDKIIYYVESSKSSEPSVSKPAKTEKKQSYVVSSGETMSGVAEKLGVSVSDLCSWNDKDAKNPSIYRGEKLVYYSNATKESTSSGKSSGTSAKNSSTYKVKKGDTMYSIAREFGISVSKLMELNSIKKERALQLEESLVVPGKATKKSSSSAKKRSHTVKQGETLWSISSKYDISVDALCKANDISAKSGLQVGKTLKIPSAE